MGDADEARELISLLRQSTERLQQGIATLDDEAVAGHSYDSEWSIAQVLSHLGSGAEIFGKIFEAAAAGESPPGQEQFSPIWDVWNAKTPAAQAHDYAEANEKFLQMVEAFDDEVLANAAIDFAGTRRGFAELLGMRLNEHVLHSWDVLVALDPAAELLPEAVPSILERLDQLVARAGKAGERSFLVGIRTSAPERELVLRAGDGKVTLGLADEEAEAHLELPAAALVRLAYGRLDPEHTPEGITASGVELDDLRAVFPGV